MSIFRKLDPRLFERNRKEVIIAWVNSVGFLVVFLFGISAIVANCKENEDGPHDNSLLSFVVCAGALAMQIAFLFIKPLWNLESIVCQVALASLSFETISFYILSHVINFDEGYLKPVVLVQVFLPFSVIAGRMLLVVSEEDSKRNLNQEGKHHTGDKIKLLEGGKRNIDNKKTDDRTNLQGVEISIDNKKTDDRIKLLEGEKRNLELELLESKKENEKLAVKLKDTQESMEDEIKALTEQSKLTETEKKKLEIDLAVKREVEDAQKDNDVSKKELEALTTAHSLHAEKLRKMEEGALRMKAEIRALKELYEYDCSKWEKNVETIAMLTYKNERREVEVNKIEKICVDLRKNLDDLRKNSFVLQGDGEKAFHGAEQALIHALLLLQQRR